MTKFRVLRQLEMTDCGPACIRMVCNHFGKCRDVSGLDAAGVFFGRFACQACGLYVLQADNRHCQGIALSGVGLAVTPG